MKVSDKIKQKLAYNNTRFYACDNISEFITEEDKEDLIKELTEKFNDVIDSLIIDRENDPNSKETGKRLAKMYVNEIMSGRYDPKPDVTAFPNEGSSNYEGMIVIRADIKSMCSHHHQPVTGTAFIGIIPTTKVLGLSKYIRLAQWEARRGTLQEELCVRIADIISKETETDDIAVYIQAKHGCCENRGVMTHNSLTQTTVLRGGFKGNPSVREEFYNNIQLQSKFECS